MYAAVKPKIYLSSAPADHRHARWAAEALTGAGYAVELPTDRYSGAASVAHVQSALDAGARIVALLTDGYFLSSACMAEAFAALEDDPHNERGRLIPVRMERCTPTGVLAGLNVADLDSVPASEKDAAFLSAVDPAEAGARDRLVLSPEPGAPARPRIGPSAPRLDPSAFDGSAEEMERLRRALAPERRGGAAVLAGPD
ncbi:MAG: toll/interleukin-1 receptor domain-containing protein, partial [Caulobacterales bacterium]|nr:toll/interleukin-1 receptor domain-containing protein [Caulobacterales bacterium]